MLEGFKLEGRLRSFALLVVAALAVLAAPGVARADTVTEWNPNASNALFVVAGQAPQASVPHMAMVHGADLRRGERDRRRPRGLPAHTRGWRSRSTRRRRRPRPRRTASC